MANEDYLNEFLPELTLAFYNEQDSETGEWFSRNRSVTKREHELHEQIGRIGQDISKIFQLGISTDGMLTDIEAELGVLKNKVKYYAEGAS